MCELCPVIAVNATDTVGPTRLRLLTAGSVKLPVVVVDQVDGAPAYYVFDVATLQAAMTNQLSPTPLAAALDTYTLVARTPSPRQRNEPRNPARRWWRTAG